MVIDFISITNYSLQVQYLLHIFRINLIRIFLKMVSICPPSYVRSSWPSKLHLFRTAGKIMFVSLGPVDVSSKKVVHVTELNI